MTEDRDLLFDEVLNQNDDIIERLDKKDMFELIQKLEKRIYRAEKYILDNNFYAVITYMNNEKAIYELDKIELLDILRGEYNEL